MAILIVTLLVGVGVLKLQLHLLDMFEPKGYDPGINAYIFGPDFFPAVIIELYAAWRFDPRRKHASGMRF